jgi:flagellin-like hook-associated protein FlgL
VTADEAGFEEAIRALSLGANASEDPVDQDALTEAYDLVNAALDDLLVTQTKLSAAASALDWEMDVQTDVQVRLEAMVSTIKEVDVAEALPAWKPCNAAGSQLRSDRQAQRDESLRLSVGGRPAGP